ncbi:NAD-dependent epimerase/dehydratase family protein [Solimicrobium silvestre]|uniref:NADH(P)-binding n=1 Tax=Solimicrobium silvestre TaxID=2099400 RepID=A0A2S9H0N8_9BURK|nr:NAD-dependent epimerase/dehydratase family protein [Solimicrobium silvestre]PRC93541.1 NADH(P)-binding [Solimicrobium silvestre]
MSEIENNKFQAIGVLGATSFVGVSVLQQLEIADRSVFAFSRRTVTQFTGGIKWLQIEADSMQQNAAENKIPLWICLAPIAVLPEYFTLLEAHCVRRVVALSSTSRFTKDNSSDRNERILSKQLADAEARLQIWAESRCVEWVILRPTLIYGFGRDKNISEIANFIRRFGFFPLLGKASGLRQPIHAQDVAEACFDALCASSSANHAYNISGDEVLTYREMVSRICFALDKRPRMLSIPLWMFSMTVTVLRILPRYRKWSGAMAERMNCDMVFDHLEAKQDFGFNPRKFALTSTDIPKC